MLPFVVSIVTYFVSVAPSAAGWEVGHVPSPYGEIPALPPPLGLGLAPGPPNTPPKITTAATTAAAPSVAMMTPVLVLREDRPRTGPPRTDFGRTPLAARFAARFWDRDVRAAGVSGSVSAAAASIASKSPTGAGRVRAAFGGTRRPRGSLLIRTCSCGTAQPRWWGRSRGGLAGGLVVDRPGQERLAEDDARCARVAHAAHAVEVGDT